MHLTHTCFQAMGTACELMLYADDQGAAKAVMADVQRLEAKYSRYRDDSYLSRINREAERGGGLDVDDETAHLLDYAATCHVQSDGLFDISSGLLRRAWNFHEPRLPDPAQLGELLGRVGWQRLQWQAPRLNFPQAGMELDLGGVVKEYAADRAATLCRERGVEHGLVNLGGDIHVIGPHPDGSPWRVGIKDPRDPEQVLFTLNLYHGALASSGDYARCFTLEGRRYGHILNPRTGWPVQGLAAVSVLADYCVVAGSAATIGMLHEEEGKAWLWGLGLPHLWVDVSGRTGGSLIDEVR